ncbi:MAG TPA: DUF4249 domain-containing protein [Flavisolibacter sp.]|nr:DUF4249 domain-containing protein [Flavisolibacter sp.]
MRTIVFFTILILAGCKDPYELPLRPSDEESLVVEGFLNSGQGGTTITLSRAVDLQGNVQFKPELGAQLFVKGKDNNTFPLAEAGNGNYTVAQLPLAAGQEYRLHIITSNGKEYQSDYIVVKQTPPIDSVSWKREGDGIGIYANTHDPANNSKYYRWEYEETWEIHSYFEPVYKWISGSTVEPLPTGEANFRCWKYLNSSAIFIGTSSKLQSDVIAEAPLIHIPINSEKLAVRYSILVKQYVLPKEGYEFFQLMKKNTESLGTIFDAQPSELRGNIHCISDPGELVIGYVSASSVEEKRIFITDREAGGTFHMYCESISILNDPDTIKVWMPSYLPYDAEKDPFGKILRYKISTQPCIDCTKRGGDLNKPSYW